jgi:hypothetical protein
VLLHAVGELVGVVDLVALMLEDLEVEQAVLGAPAAAVDADRVDIDVPIAVHRALAGLRVEAADDPALGGQQPALEGTEAGVVWQDAHDEEGAVTENHIVQRADAALAVTMRASQGC